MLTPRMPALAAFNALREFIPRKAFCVGDAVRKFLKTAC